MRILLVTTFYPPEGKAGTEVYTRTLAEELHRQGHEVGVVCVTSWNTGPRHWNGVKQEQMAGVHVYRLALNWQRASMPNHSLFDNPLVGDWFRELLLKLQPDIVHVISCLTLSASVVRVAKTLKQPVIITLMDFWFICPRHTLMRYDLRLCDGRTTNLECLKCLAAGAKVFRWPRRMLPEPVVLAALDRISHHGRITSMPGMRGIVQDMQRRRHVLHSALEQADCLISHSRFLSDTFRAAGISAPIVVIKNGHDLNWRTGTSIPPISKRPLRFGTLSHIAEIKGIHLAVEAFLDLPTQHDIELWIFGRMDKDSDYVQRLLAVTSEHPRIQIKGTYERQELADVFAQLDVVIVPSQWYENAPLTIYEAFAAGKPVIATNLGGMAEAVHHGTNGLLFDVGNAKSLSQQMLRFIEDPHLLGLLQRGIPSVRTAANEVTQLSAKYLEVLNTCHVERHG